MVFVQIDFNTEGTESRTILLNGGINLFIFQAVEIYRQPAYLKFVEPDQAVAAAKAPEDSRTSFL